MTPGSRKAQSSRLFDPVEIGPLRLRNRIVMAPMTRRFSPGGIPTPAVARYYQRRAEGGAGLIITEGLEIGHRSSVHHPAIPNFYDEAALSAWQGIARGVHVAGAAFIPQFWHVGGYRSVGLPPPSDGIEATSPSGVYIPGQPYGVPASDAEIADVIEAYASAAQAAFRIGCDGIELHGGHGYLIDQFFWAATNHRTDRYGGELADRTRFACDVVTACRERTSPDFPIFLRFSQWKTQDYTARLATDPASLGRLLAPLAQAGVDVFDCSTRRFWEPEFDGSELNLAGWTRALTGKPVMTVGSVGLDNDVVASLYGGVASSGVSSLDRLERMLERGDFDLVGVGRALLADPDWPRKVQEGNTHQLKGFTRAALDVLV